MIVPAWRWRFVCVVACAAVSTLAGCALLFRLVTPESVGQLRTMELLGLLGLVVLPWVSLWAYVVDRRIARRVVVEAAVIERETAAGGADGQMPAAAMAREHGAGNGRVPGRHVHAGSGGRAGRREEAARPVARSARAG